jgi:hypothetical protein
VAEVLVILEPVILKQIHTVVVAGGEPLGEAEAALTLLARPVVAVARQLISTVILSLGLQWVCVTERYLNYANNI